jgi:hypothetical protein
MRLWFRCSHSKISRPLTEPRKGNEINRLNNTYVECLKCGERIPYSFSEGRAVGERRREPQGGAGVSTLRLGA